MRRVTQNLTRMLGRNVWALADQALIAATSFLAMMLLARRLSIADFGLFALIYSLLYFANSMQAGLVTQPHNVLGATRNGAEYARYTSTTALSQLALALASAILALAGCLTAYLLGATQVAALLLAAAPATLAWQLQEFTRRVLYTEQRILTAFVCDLIGYGGQALGILLLWRADRLTGATMLSAVSVACAIACVFGFLQIRRSISPRMEWAVLRENWHFGKWIAGGTIIAEWLSAQMLVYIAAAMLGVTAAGVLRAVHTLFGPTRIIAQVYSITLPTRLAIALETGGRETLMHGLRLALLSAVGIFGTYCLLVALLAGPVLRLAFGEKYVDYAGVLQLYAVSALLTYVFRVFAAALRAQRRTRAIFVSELIYIVVIPAGGLLIPLWGLSGLVVGLIVGDVLATLYVARACVLNLRSDEPVEIDAPVMEGAMS